MTRTCLRSARIALRVAERERARWKQRVRLRQHCRQMSTMLYALYRHRCAEARLAKAFVIASADDFQHTLLRKTGLPLEDPRVGWIVLEHPLDVLTVFALNLLPVICEHDDLSQDALAVLTMGTDALVHEWFCDDDATLKLNATLKSSLCVQFPTQELLRRALRDTVRTLWHTVHSSNRKQKCTV